MLVTGGFYDSGFPTDSSDLSSTELLASAASAWVTVTPLAWAVRGLAGATLDNRVLVTGEQAGRVTAP